VANGVKEMETYTEKVERVTPEGLRYFFNVYTLVRYPKQEYDRAVALAASAKHNVQRAVNDAQAQKVIEDLDKGLPTY